MGMRATTNTTQPGFTLIEIIAVITIITIFSLMAISTYRGAIESARVARVSKEANAIYKALETYHDEHGSYPDDVNRGLPSGIEENLGAGEWPNGPWEHSVYDWDAWTTGGGEDIHQISVRFCESESECSFPDTTWAEHFDYYSAAYYCVQGPCRSHISKPIDHPGHCLNCNE